MWLLAACTGAPDPLARWTDGGEPSAELDGDAIVYVGTDATFDAGASVGVTFTWDFGDGTTGGGRTPTHAYAEPGRYTVRLTASSTDGRTDTASATRVAVYEPLATAPASSGRLALSDGVLYAAIPEADTVVVVEGNAVVDRLDVCGHPVSVSAAYGVLAVACRDDAVQLWDTTSRTIEREETFRWGARPVAIAVDVAGALSTDTGGPPAACGAIVAFAGTGEIVRVSPEGVEAVGTVEDPGAVATADATWVARFRSPAEGGEVTVFADPGSTSFSLAADPGPDSDTDARGLPNLLGALSVRPDGRAIVVAGTKANMDRGLVRDGLALTHETTTRAALRSVDATSGEPLARAMFDNRDRVGAVAFTPAGDLLLVAHLGAGIVDLLDPFTLTRLGGFQGVGVGLDGIATDGETAWVLASADRELVAYDLSELSAETEVARVDLLDAEPLSDTLLLGKRMFTYAGDPRMSTDAYVSCASCHPDGATDARTWDFTDRGEGLRDTQALFAMPVEGPFHWTANFDELQDFENAIRAFQAGDGFLSVEDFGATEDPLGEPKAGLSEELDALAAYVTSFTTDVPRSPFREADGTWTEAALRGREVFLAEGCDTCHAGAATTDAAWNEDGTPVLHDIGTLLETSGGRLGEPLTGLRTPTLRGLWATAPYLHDGRAATLEEAVEAHGVEADPDLVAYLREVE